jgi:hypothetical protein
LKKRFDEDVSFAKQLVAKENKDCAETSSKFLYSSLDSFDIQTSVPLF